MGWWNIKHGTELVIGDGPADIMDNALLKIVEEYERSVGRKPTYGELEACFHFSSNVYCVSSKVE